MTDSTTTDGAQPDTGVHAAHPLLADHHPDETLALGERLTKAANDETSPVRDDEGDPIAESNGEV